MIIEADPAGADAAQRSARRRVRCQLVGCVLTLVGLTIALPDPASGWGEFTTVPLSGAANAVDAVGGALLAAAAIVVRGLLGWCLLVAAALCMARLPGDAGHAGRATLRRLAPLPAVRVLGLAVGLSVIAGTSACAAPLMAADDGSSTAATAAASGTQAAVPSSPALSATPPSTTVAVDIDWPGTTAPAESTVTGAQGIPTPAVTAARPTAPSAVPDTPGRSAAVATNSKPSPVASTSGTGSTPATNEGGHPLPGAVAPGRDGAEPPAGPVSDAVTVRPGDSLWAIAQRALPTPAADDAIDTAWRAWYLANAAVIGDNPDLIRPGQVLQPPYSRVG